MHDVTIRTDPPRRLAAVSHKGPYTEVGKAFEKFVAIATEHGLWPNIRGMAGVYLDDPSQVEASELRAMVGGIFEGDSLPEGLESLDLGSGRFAVLTHKGPYETLASGWQHLFGEWLPKSGEQPGDTPPFELYVSDPETTPQEDLITEILLPLK